MGVQCFQPGDLKFPLFHRIFPCIHIVTFTSALIFITFILKYLFLLVHSFLIRDITSYLLHMFYSISFCRKKFMQLKSLFLPVSYVIRNPCTDDVMVNFRQCSSRTFPDLGTSSSSLWMSGCRATKRNGTEEEKM
jgi:hypothetical protein